MTIDLASLQSRDGARRIFAGYVHGGGQLIIVFSMEAGVHWYSGHRFVDLAISM